MAGAWTRKMNDGASGKKGKLKGGKPNDPQIALFFLTYIQSHQILTRFGDTVLHHSTVTQSTGKRREMRTRHQATDVTDSLSSSEESHTKKI